MSLPDAGEGMQTVLFWGDEGPWFDGLGLPLEKPGPVIGLDVLEARYAEAISESRPDKARTPDGSCRIEFSLGEVGINN